MQSGNIFKTIPQDLTEEVIDLLVQGKEVKIERIISRGQSSPESGWYDQQQNEWVMVLKGEAILSFEYGKEIELKTGDYITIPAHTLHRVKWTNSDIETIWLAVHY